MEDSGYAKSMSVATVFFSFVMLLTIVVSSKRHLLHSVFIEF